MKNAQPNGKTGPNNAKYMTRHILSNASQWIKTQLLAYQQKRKKFPSTLVEFGTVVLSLPCRSVTVKRQRASWSSKIWTGLKKITNFILKATFSKHICHCARTKAYRRSSFQVKRLVTLSHHQGRQSPERTLGRHNCELRATAQDNSVFLIIFFCLILKHNNTLQESFSTLFDFSVRLWIIFFFFFCVVLCFFFSLSLLFTWATGTKILFNTLFIAHNFWWRLFRRPSPQISQRGVLAVFLFGVGTVLGDLCALGRGE